MNFDMGEAIKTDMTMKGKRYLFLVATLFCSIFGYAQNNNYVDSLKASIEHLPEDTNKVNALLNLSKVYLNTEPKDAIPYGEAARDLSKQLNFEKGLAQAYKIVGNAHAQQSNYLEAMENWRQSLAHFEKMGDLIGIANIQSNIGAVYQYQGNEEKALDFLFKSLGNSEESRDQFRIASALINIGSVYQHKTATYDKAITYYLRALPMSERLGDNDHIGTIAGNIGEIYLQRGYTDTALYYFKKAEHALRSTVDLAEALINIGKVYTMKRSYDTALMYYQQAYDSAIILDSKLYQIRSLVRIADVYNSKGNNRKALNAYLAANVLAEEINSLAEQKGIYEGLAKTYSALLDFKNAFKYQNELLKVKDVVYNKELDIKLSNYEFNFEIEKKQNKINLLEKDKVLQELDIKRQKFAKNSFIAGFGLILVIAFILYRNYLNKVRVNKLLDNQKAQIESLLLNILPAEVASELKEVGHATPRYYESVSVLFTDFKGFTLIADSLSPQEVVAELNDCFVSFDEIIEKHQLEKIKTIGDSYMCAGGIPVKSDDHPLRIINAALEIQELMQAKNKNRKQKGLPPWELRIGVHIGPVVAGVVGKNKYAYDIWGSTVNIASRMETNSDPGRVNISAATYELVKGSFDCAYRGKISAKNIGEIDMYFVQRKSTIQAFTEFNPHEEFENATE
jgi:adenylate cyclase